MEEVGRMCGKGDAKNPMRTFECDHEHMRKRLMFIVTDVLQPCCLPSEGGDDEAKHGKLMLGGSSLTPAPPGLSVGWPSCHLSNDFFILQEELVARGNTPLPAGGNPTLVQADAGTRYVCSHITRDLHTLSSCLCFFAFLLPLSTQSSVSPFLRQPPLFLGVV